ncbi:MAG: ABC transporter ATP-binding protein [Gemmatimonadota bacterium]
MIAARGVSKRYGRYQVLDGLDATIGRGRITALLGANGVGKTTFLKLVLELIRPDRGTICVDGHLLDGTPDYRARIGYMPQIARFPAQMTGRGLLNLLTEAREAPGEPDLTLLDLLDVGHAFDQQVGTLSGGTRQKVNAVLTFAFGPELLVLDEPTAGLDPASARALKKRIRAEREAGHTVLMTSHVLADLEELADDALHLDGGGNSWHGSMEALRIATGESSLEAAVARLGNFPPLRAVA